MLEKTITFIRENCFDHVGLLADESLLIACKGCDRKSWMIDDITHKKNCKVRVILKELDWVLAKLRDNSVKQTKG